VNWEHLKSFFCTFSPTSVIVPAKMGEGGGKKETERKDVTDNIAQKGGPMSSF